MNLRKACLETAEYRAAVETEEQLDACLESKRVQLVWIDSASFSPQKYGDIVKKAHSAGVSCGLRTPYIWRREAEVFFDAVQTELKQAGFDAWLFRNAEGALYFREHGLTEQTNFVTDHSMYVWNREAEQVLLEMLGPAGITLPLELNVRELSSLCKSLQTPAELIVYGRAPMMVSAQCLRKTTGECRKRMPDNGEILYLKDRTGAEMPVRNYCRFCYNIIYNSVPTVIFDLEKEIRQISPHSVRYEFSTESGPETFAVLEGRVPKGNSAFTRGHLHRGV
ncbi:MAG: U32 family peptidase [Lachnospiraceae bacterium]|nr:U32 family peptidase [Lachnospiraceae bacterium]